MMLVCDGITSTKKIRELEKRIVKNNIPIIVISAYSLDDVKDQLSLSEVNGFMGKPVDFTSLQTILVCSFRWIVVV